MVGLPDGGASCTPTSRSATRADTTSTVHRTLVEAATAAQRSRVVARRTAVTPMAAPAQADRLKVRSRPSVRTAITLADSKRPEAERAASISHTAMGSSIARKAPRAFGFPKVAY